MQWCNTFDTLLLIGGITGWLVGGAVYFGRKVERLRKELHFLRFHVGNHLHNVASEISKISLKGIISKKDTKCTECAKSTQDTTSSTSEDEDLMDFLQSP
jgi:hypothetical protein